MKSILLSNNDIEEIQNLEGASIAAIARKFNVSARTVKRVLDGTITEGADDYVGKLTRQNQKRADVTNHLRKQVREGSRAANVIMEMTKELTNVIEENAFTVRSRVTHHRSDSSKPVGVIHLSDLHAGERVKNVLNGGYDLQVLSARIKKLVNRAKLLFKSVGVTNVLIASTGDMINSDRRLDEITSNVNNRTKIAFCAVDLIQQMIVDLNEDFNITYASVCGNESRVGEEIGWTDWTASDNYDATIHNTLLYIFKNCEGVDVLPMNHPLEAVVNVNGSNFLLIHGHNKTASTNKAEVEVAKLRSKYATQNINIDYVIFGHIHATYISDYFARGASTVGSNSYSDNALNLVSKAAQNLYVVYGDGSIDGIKVDLQNYDPSDAYIVNPEVEEYKPVGRNNTVVIQSVLI